MRRLLGNLLVVIGLVLMAWPVIAWAYGQYWQRQLSRDFQRRVFLARRATAARHARVVHAMAIASAAMAAGEHTRALAKRAIHVHLMGPRSKPMPQPIADSEDPTLDGGAFGWLHRQTAQAEEWTRGTPVARLHITRIGLDAIVVEGADAAALRQGPGHLPETGMPGDDRNCAIAAHRDAWFRRLHDVRVGDPVQLETPDGLYEYAVTKEMVVAPNRSDLLDQGYQPMLTLITCTGPGYPHSRYRLLVFCRLHQVVPR